MPLISVLIFLSPVEVSPTSKLRYPDSTYSGGRGRNAAIDSRRLSRSILIRPFVSRLPPVMFPSICNDSKTFARELI